MTAHSEIITDIDYLRVYGMLGGERLRSVWAEIGRLNTRVAELEKLLSEAYYESNDLCRETRSRIEVLLAEYGDVK